MKSPAFTLEEDLYALASLSPTNAVQVRLAQYLQSIQAAGSLAHKEKWVDHITAYMHALEDLELLNAEQWILLRELVTRACLRSSAA
jgi:hypothetical protein